jgi:hypothetical protein
VEAMQLKVATEQTGKLNRDSRWAKKARLRFLRFSLFARIPF